MPTKDQTHTVQFDERLKTLTRRTHITETFNSREVYNIYINLKRQIAEFEATLQEMKESLAELEPNFLRIKDEVENQIKKEREKSG